MMQKKLNKIAKDTNIFLKRFIKKQKKSELIVPPNDETNDFIDPGRLLYISTPSSPGLPKFKINVFTISLNALTSSSGSSSTSNLS